MIDHSENDHAEDRSVSDYRIIETLNHDVTHSIEIENP